MNVVNLNKFKENAYSVTTSIWFLGVIGVLVLSLFLPNFFNKYNLELVEQIDRSETKVLTFFEDFNNDGLKQKISILNNRNRFASCLLQKNDGKIIDQFNLYGEIPNQENLNIPIFNDVNNDGVKELFIFTQKADSLFINAIDFSSFKVILYGRFISKIGMDNKFNDFVLRPIINHDYNADGVKEMYFLLNGGYSLFPRKIMAYDFKNDTIISSINTGGQHFVKPVKMGEKLIITSTTPRTNNCPADFPFQYPDNASRLFSFNDKLQLMFEPLAFKGVSCSVNGPIIYKNELHYDVLNCGDEGLKNFMIRMNLQGEILEKKEFKQALQNTRSEKIVLDFEKHYLFNSIENGFFTNYEYKPELMLFNENSFTEKLPKGALISLKFDNENNVNLLVDFKTKRASLLLDNLKYKVSFDKELYLKDWNLYIQTKNVSQGTIIMVTNRKELFSFLLSNNEYFPLRYVLYAVLYFLCVGLIYLPRRRRLLNTSNRIKLQKEISSLQLKLVNAQLDPHFTFNALNTVSAKILKGERFEAYDLMTSFSNLMRSAMLHSDKNRWELQEELDFSQNYLILMQGRFKNVFTFSFKIDPTITIEAVFVPRLLIQNFIENIIKHAFKNIDYKGIISVEIGTLENNLEIKISDNGIGRDKAQINTLNDVNKSGKGIGLNREQLRIYNKLYATQINFEIIDLYLNNSPSGTQVIITIPKTL